MRILVRLVSGWPEEGGMFGSEEVLSGYEDGGEDYDVYAEEEDGRGWRGEGGPTRDER